MAVAVSIQGHHRCRNWARSRQLLQLWWSHQRRSGSPSRATTSAATGGPGPSCCTCGGPPRGPGRGPICPYCKQEAEDHVHRWYKCRKHEHLRKDLRDCLAKHRVRWQDFLWFPSVFTYNGVMPQQALPGLKAGASGELVEVLQRMMVKIQIHRMELDGMWIAGNEDGNGNKTGRRGRRGYQHDHHRIKMPREQIIMPDIQASMGRRGPARLRIVRI